MNDISSPPEARATPSLQGLGDHDRLVSFTELQLRLGVCRSTLFRMRQRGQLPAEIRIGGRAYFQVRDVIEWLERMKKRPATNQ